MYNRFVNFPIDRLKIQDTRFINSLNKLVVSELKLKNLFVQTLAFNVGVGFIRPVFIAGSMNRTPTEKVNSYTIEIIIKINRRKYL